MDERILQARDEILKGILANKQELVKKYGNKAEQIAYATAMQKAKAQFKNSSKIQEYLNNPSVKFSIIDKLIEQYIPEPEIWDYEPTYQEIEDFEKHQAYRDWETDRKSTRLNSSHITRSRMPSSA